MVMNFEGKAWKWIGKARISKREDIIHKEIFDLSGEHGNYICCKLNYSNV